MREIMHIKVPFAPVYVDPDVHSIRAYQSQDAFLLAREGKA